MSESSLFDLLPAYALGALSDEEKAQVEAFLASSEEARAELRTYQEMLAGMATLVPLRRSPAHLTDDFRRRLSQTPETPVIQLPERRRGMARRTRWLLGVAALIAVILGIFGIYNMLRLVLDAQTVAAILKSPDAKWITLSAQSGASGTVSLCIVPTSNKAVLIEQLPPLPPGKQYQLWLIDAEGRENGGVFSADHSEKHILINMPDVPAKYQRLGITVEPYGGSPGPTSPPVFTGLFNQ